MFSLGGGCLLYSDNLAAFVQKFPFVFAEVAQCYGKDTAEMGYKSDSVGFCIIDIETMIWACGPTHRI